MCFKLLNVFSITLQALKKSKDEYVPMCRVPLITSSKEEQHIISTCRKPIVKLSCNRHNNKYSYTRYVVSNMTFKSVVITSRVISKRFSVFIRDCCLTVDFLLK